MAQKLRATHGVSINAIVLAYLISQPLQTIAICGGSSPEQVRDSVSTAARVLAPEELARLRDA